MPPYTAGGMLPDIAEIYWPDPQLGPYPSPPHPVDGCARKFPVGLLVSVSGDRSLHSVNCDQVHYPTGRVL